MVWVVALVCRPDAKQSRTSQSTYYIRYLSLDLAVEVSSAVVGNRFYRARGIRYQINQDESSQGRLTPEHGDPTSERDNHSSSEVQVILIAGYPLCLSLRRTGDGSGALSQLGGVVTSFPRQTPFSLPQFLYLPLQSALSLAFVYTHYSHW